MKYFITIILFSLSFESYAVPVGMWVSEYKNNSYSVKIWQKDDGIFVIYSFIFNNGSKINSNLESANKFKTIGGGCYTGMSSDISNDKDVKVVICMNEGYLYWSKLGINSDTPYVPRYIPFHPYVE